MATVPRRKFHELSPPPRLGQISGSATAARLYCAMQLLYEVWTPSSVFLRLPSSITAVIYLFIEFAATLPIVRCKPWVESFGLLSCIFKEIGTEVLSAEITYYFFHFITSNKLNKAILIFTA